MYWTDQISAKKIRRANLDGTGVEDLVTTGLFFPTGIALDVAGGKMYWTDFGTNRIHRANLDGTNVENVVTGLSGPVGIALDVAGGKVYWVENALDKIQRADLDGTNVEDLVTGLSSPQGIALDVANGKMYWTDNTTDKIQRANLDGTNVEDLITTGLVAPAFIALETAVTPELSAIGPLKVWVGLKNSDAVGLRLDLKAEVFLNSTASTPIGTGEVVNVGSGSSGFNNAQLNTIALTLSSGPVEIADGDQLLLRVSVRRTCFGGGHNSGTLRLWYNGKAIDSGPARDAGSRLTATIDSTTSDFYLGTGFELSTTEGASRTSIDKLVNSSAPCPNRPFTPFGTWSTAP
jgi:low density lipoprotein receptor-related protein 5/6